MKTYLVSCEEIRTFIVEVEAEDELSLIHI